MFLYLFFFFVISDSIPICHVSYNQLLSKSIRIPRNIYPTKYFISYYFDSELTVFRGSVDIEIVFLNPTNLIILHSDVSITSYSIGQISCLNTCNTSVYINNTCHIPEHQIIIFELSHYMNINDNGILSIRFFNDVSNGQVGLYSSMYRSKNGVLKKIISTKFEPDRARSAFPCFDEPSYKSIFILELDYPSKYKSSSNTEPDQITTNNDYTSIRYKPSPKMSTYLLAIVIHHFESRTTFSKSNTKISVWLDEEILDQGIFALEVAKQALDICEEIFNLTYNLEKLDIIGIPKFESNAMENWGIILFRLDLLILDNNSTIKQQNIAKLMVHEIVHQWFGNLVTMNWWNDLWLNEGFATYMEYFLTDKIFPDSNIMNRFSYLTILALSYDELTTTHALSLSEDSNYNIHYMFDGITYYKGSSLIQMLMLTIGEENFINLIRAYLLKYQYDSANSDKFWEILERVMNNSIYTEMMNKWSKNIGYPLVTMNRLDKCSYVISQERMYLTANEELITANRNSNIKWIIPIKYITIPYTSNNETILLDSSNNTYNLCSDGIIKLNHNLNYFYRVNYDDEMWMHFAEQLLSNINIFSPRDRLSLISDIFAMTKISRVSILTAMDLISYMSRENDLSVMYEIIRYFKYINDLTIDYPLLNRKFQQYVLGLLDQLYKKTPFNTVSPSADERSYQKLILFSNILFKNPDAIESSISQFQNFMKNPSSVPIELAPNYACGALLNATKNYWLEIFNVFRQTDNNYIKEVYMYGLSCAENQEILNTYLEFSLDKSLVQVSCHRCLLMTISSNPYSSVVTWNFMKTHWNTLHGLYYNSPRIVNSLIFQFAGKMKTVDQLRDFKNFFTDNYRKDLDRGINDAVEHILLNINFISNNLQSLNEWLK